MPAGHYDHQDSYLATHRSPAYTPNRTGNSSYNGDESTASILKSVKAQEAQFEKLTRELEAERQSVAQQLEECRAGSETASMNSITSTDDSFHWRGPQTLADSQIEDDSANETKMSSHLLDSCLKELDNRGVMNAGYSREDNMDYMHEDPYSSHGRIPYGSDPYNPNYSSGALNGGNPHYHIDERSPHSSHVSLHSTGSNRNPAKMVQKPGSMGSLPHDQHDNYMSYSSLSRPQYEDSRGSPLPPSGSPRGPGTPTRFNSYEPPYSSTQLYNDNSPRYSVDSNDSFHRPPHDNYNHYDPRDMGHPHDMYNGPPSDHGQPPYSGHPSMQYDPRYETNSPYNDHPNRDQYGDMDPHNDSRVSDSFYRDSPVGGRYDGPRGPQMDPMDRRLGPDMYEDGPQDMYRDGPVRDLYDGPEQSMDRYNDPSFEDDRYRGPPVDDRHPDISMPESGYRDSPVMGGQYPQEQYSPNSDRYRDQPPDERFRDMSLDDQQREPPMDDRYGEPPGGDRYREGEPTFDDYDDHPYRQPDRKHDGLPPVPNDPFADDPFQRKASEQYLGPPVDDRYRDDDRYDGRTPSPGAGSDRYGPYGDRPPQYEMDRQQPPYYDDDTLDRTEALKVGAPPMHNYPPDDGRRTPSDAGGKFVHNYPPDDGRRTPSDAGGSTWRNPDLQEVIDFLSHPSDAIKANAAAYLQHLCYNDDDMKAKAKGLDGIPPLVELLRSEYPEVQRNACGALKNLSYGRGKTGLDNKKAIENAGGITALIRLLRKAQDEDIKELVTGILWNLSTCEELKGKIITEGLTDIVSRVIVPYSGWERRGLMQYPSNEPWTMVFKNATGIIRNLSSAYKEDDIKGYEMRNKLRECSKLVNCLVYSIKVSVENHDKENKPVENCTCALRNLSFRIQEVCDRDFHKKRAGTLKRKQQPQNEKTGCFGQGGNKKKAQQKPKAKKPDLNQNAEMYLPPSSQEYQALWLPDVIRLYISILRDGSNPVTVEAAAGAIQNLTACYWQYAEHIRELVRKEKGLAFLVDLLTQESDGVVCHAALALRNLAIDEKNKDLIGKHGMKQLISQLPKEGQNEHVPDRTICAVIATIHEVTKSTPEYAKQFSENGGIPKLKFIKFSRGKFQQKTKEHCQTLIQALWEFKELHQIYINHGLTEPDVKAAPTPGRMNESRVPGTNYNTPYSTMSRPMASQGYDDQTLSRSQIINQNYEQNQPMNGRIDNYSGGMVQGHSNPAMNESSDRYNYQDNRRRGDEIPMQDMGPGYAPIDDDRPRRTKPPVGGVPLFPNLQPQRQADTPSPQQVPPTSSHEPLYAQVNKSNKRRPEDMMGPPSPNHVMLDAGSPQGGADSWV